MPIKTKFKALLTLALLSGSVLFAAVAFAASATYTYDDLDRLIRVEYDDGTAIGYEYDELGNRMHSYTNPIASFTGAPLAAVYPLTVNFTDSSTGNVTSWLWDFGDNTTSTDKNPTHTYYNADVYTVSLTATNILGSNTMTKTAYVNSQPAPGPYHAQIPGKGNYTSLQAAYNAAADGDTIKAQAQIYNENLAANRNISVTLVGGFVPDYSWNPGTTYIRGTLTTSSGTLNVSNIVLRQ